MASLSKRMSISSTRSGRSQSPLARLVVAPNAESEEWIRAWENTLAQDLIESPVVDVDAETTVEEACELLLSRDMTCLAVKSPSPGASNAPYCGLFDFADVNAFLTFAATRHTYSPEHLGENPRVAQIVEAAKAGRVPVHLVSNLSEKNPLLELPHDASVVSLLGAFSSGTHRVLIKSPSPGSSPSHLGTISDRRLLAYFASFARPASSPSPEASSPIIASPMSSRSASFNSPTSSFLRYLNNPLSSLSLPSLNLHSEVVAVTAADSVLNAMKVMSELGVSSVAVLQEDTGNLLSAVSVTDIGKIVVPSQSNQILSMPLHQLVAQIKLPDGSTDGADKYPVYSVSPTSTLSYTMQKLLASMKSLFPLQCLILLTTIANVLHQHMTANAHRVFVTADSPSSSSPSVAGLAAMGNLSGIVSIVDILSLFARIANLPDVDPTRMQRHRRASSASSHSATSGSFSDLVRTSSRGSLTGRGAGRPPHTVGYEEGDPNVADRMQSGYPRFFIHLSIQKLAVICEQKFGTPSERCILLPSARTAEFCRAFLTVRCVSAHIVQLSLPDSLPGSGIHAVFFPSESFPVAKQFWQHTGLGVSSRLAEHYLSLLARTGTPSSPTAVVPSKTPNKHYAAKSKRVSSISSVNGSSGPAEQTGGSAGKGDVLDADMARFIEERYGRNLNVSSASNAKTALRRRIAGVLFRDSSAENGEAEVELGQSIRGVPVTEKDVYLYPTGMSAICSAHQLALGALGERKSVCFGFPYTDTLKILEKWGPGCYFLGHGLDETLDELETILSTRYAEDPSKPPILALFTEFPSNPLLRSGNLPRIRELADLYDFLVVVDETIGNFVNVQVLPYADIVVTSLTKVFSGDSNVMGGSLVLNPAQRHYEVLKAHMDETYEDIYFDEDAIFMERNSRDFIRRISVIDVNTEVVCDFLHAAKDSASPVIKEVFYPKWQTPENYDLCRIKGPDGREGPSLGTNFTLACPYAILAHYAELDWAESYGVSTNLVRVSVGMEPRDVLLNAFKKALKAAEEAHQAAAS
ncbi:hypothetical protein EW146_g5744 [Bondarzewia mesenterica]|uniref:CBS domain-containing protein n=1 Tax=Bondarzewia mesenterica TaxID=1095465 RepID=A0A4S4LQJ3_9AGAM|nr:hypothetical protein EW146_g5744 [Bondarzewia mesenterica]